MFTLDKHSEDNITDEFFKLINRPPENSRVFEMTPSLCEKLLDPEEGRNQINRSKKPVKIAEFAQAMRSDQWGLTGDTVKMSRNGFVLDGQNRCAASVLAQKPFLTHVVFGIDASVFDRIDTGKNRSAGDIFQIAGIKNSGLIAGAVRWVDILEGDNPKTDRAARTGHYLLKKYYENAMEEDLANGAGLAKAVASIYGHPAPLILAIWYVAHKKYPLQATQFLEFWANGDRVKGAAMLKAQQLVNNQKEVSLGRVHDRVRAGILINAWNEFKRGRKGTKKTLNYTLSQPFPEIM